MVERAGWPVRWLEAPGFRRKLSPELVANVYKINRAAKKAGVWLAEFDPDVAVGFGGAVTFPVIRTAKAQDVSVIIQEQNAVPGLANRYLGRLADVIAVAGPAAKKGWPRGWPVVVTGNPIRLKHLGTSRATARQALQLPPDGHVVTVFGGSQGARHLNDEIVKAYTALAKPEITLLHLTGARDYGDIVNAWSAAGANPHVKMLPYLDDMGLAYRASDLVICRAGASTLAELAAYGVPAILVPYPYAANDHQTKNAAVVADAGAAVVLPDAELSADSLAVITAGLLVDEGRLVTMARSAAATGYPDAARTLASLVMELADKVE